MALAVILALAVGFGYLNGVNGSASVVATMISSRAAAPRTAVILAVLGMSTGPLLLGVAVANTIGAELVRPQAMSSRVVIAALLGAIAWSTFTVWLKIPSSTTQAMIGGLIGAVWAGFGGQMLLLTGLEKAILALFLSPTLGMLMGFAAVRLSYGLSASATPHINRWFNRGQVLVSMLLAIAFGANDAQKIMGMMTMGLVATGFLPTFVVPRWVMLLSAAAVSVGMLTGGWRLIHTLGGKFYKIRPIHGFGAQLASGLVIFGAAVLGGPVSSSQVVTSAIVGAGSADRMQMVRWNMVRQMLISWVLTLPLSALVSALMYSLLSGVAQ